MRFLIMTALIWMGLSLAAMAQTLSSVSYNGSDIVLRISKPDEVKVFSIGEDNRVLSLMCRPQRLT